jgi:hypothetical protein
MQGIEQLLQQVQSRQSRKPLREAARSAFAALDSSERRELFAEFAEMVMADEAAPNKPTAPEAVPASIQVAVASPTNGGVMSKIDRAEQLVMAQPGISSREVGTIIGQTPSTAGSTLSQLAERRGTVENRNGGWYPVPKKDADGTPSIRDLIVAVMSDDVARGTGDICRAVAHRDPNANKNSVNAQVHRMRTMTPPMLVPRDKNDHGQQMWGLAIPAKDGAVD